MVTIDKTSANIIANLILEDIHGYSKQFPTEYTAFCKIETEKKKQEQLSSTKKRRKQRLKQP